MPRTPARSADSLHPEAFAFLGCGRSNPKGGADTSGRAGITSPRQSDGERLRLACLRELLIADLREARRAHRERSSIEARLRAVTLQLLTFHDAAAANSGALTGSKT